MITNCQKLYQEINDKKRDKTQDESLIVRLCPRLFGPCAAVHSDQDGGGLDIPGSSGTDYGSGQLEYGLRQRQKPAR